MKKLIHLCAVIVLIILLVCCKSCFNNNKMKIKATELTEKETSLLKLVSIDNNSKIYDYTVDKSIKSMQINCLRLNSDGKWENSTGSSQKVKYRAGRIAITNVDKRGDFCVSVQDKHGLSSFTSTVQEGKDYNDLAKAIVWREKGNIVSNKSIPLVIAIMTSSNQISIFDISSFNDTEKLRQFDIVNALTITFSEEIVD